MGKALIVDSDADYRRGLDLRWRGCRAVSYTHLDVYKRQVEINPQTAEEYGIEQGDWVWIETEWGKIREVADLYYGVKEDVINLEHTWWYPCLLYTSHLHAPRPHRASRPRLAERLRIARFSTI